MRCCTGKDHKKPLDWRLRRPSPFHFVSRPKEPVGSWEPVLDYLVATRKIKSWRYRAHGSYICVVRITPRSGPSWDTHVAALGKRMAYPVMDIPLWMMGDEAEEWRDGDDEFFQFLHTFMVKRLEMGASVTGNACAQD